MHTTVAELDVVVVHHGSNSAQRWVQFIEGSYKMIIKSNNVGMKVACHDQHGAKVPRASLHSYLPIVAASQLKGFTRGLPRVPSP
jgi:hypothetical protein